MSQMKLTCIGRRPQNTKCPISQQPLIRSYSNFKLKLWGPNQCLQMSRIKTTCIGRRSQNTKCQISEHPLVGLRYFGKEIWNQIYLGAEPVVGVKNGGW
jgi:hypothetical protein